MKLAGTTALVTGASHGMGAATARLMARRGARVALAARDETALATVAREIKAQGGDAVVVVADLSDADQVEALRQQVTARWGTPDVIVNSAGAGRFLFIEETTPDDFVTQMGAPYFATCFVTRAFIEPMIARGSGRVVNVNSPSSRMVWPGSIGYAAARWALRGFTEALRADLAGTGVGVTEALIGKVSSSYWTNNPGAEARLPGFAKRAPALTPDQAAIAIVRGVEADAPLVTAPWIVRLLLMQAHLAPGPAAALMIRTGARRSQESRV